MTRLVTTTWHSWSPGALRRCTSSDPRRTSPFSSGGRSPSGGSSRPWHPTASVRSQTPHRHRATILSSRPCSRHCNSPSTPGMDRPCTPLPIALLARRSSAPDGTIEQPVRRLRGGLQAGYSKRASLEPSSGFAHSLRRTPTLGGASGLPTWLRKQRPTRASRRGGRALMTSSPLLAALVSGLTAADSCGCSPCTARRGCSSTRCSWRTSMDSWRPGLRRSWPTRMGSRMRTRRRHRHG